MASERVRGPALSSASSANGDTTNLLTENPPSSACGSRLRRFFGRAPSTSDVDDANYDSASSIGDGSESGNVPMSTTSASSAPSSRAGRIRRFFNRVQAEEEDERQRMRRVFEEIAEQKRRKRLAPDNAEATTNATGNEHANEAQQQVPTVQENVMQQLGGSLVRRFPKRVDRTSRASNASRSRRMGHEITSEHLTAALGKSDRQVFHKWTRAFRDARLETKYQEFSILTWFSWARMHVLLWMGMHLFVGLLFVLIPKSGFQHMNMFEYDAWAAPTLLQFLYLLIALPFVVLPMKINPFQRRWRYWVCCIVIIFNLTFQFWLGHANRLAVGRFEHDVEDAVRNPYNASVPLCNSSAINTQLDDIEHVTHVYAGALVQVASVFSSLFSFIFVIAIRLEFLQAISVGGCALATYLFVVAWNHYLIELMTAMAYVFAVILLLILSYASDRNNRRSFLSQLMVDNENESMKSTLNKAGAALMNGAAREEEKKVVESVLDVPEMRHLEQLRIPFSAIKLLQAIGRGGMGDVIKAKYLGTIVVCKRMRRENINEAAIKSFGEEIELMSLLRHPNIVQFIGASWDNCSNICIVMEYMENGDIYSVLHSSIGRNFTWADPLLKMAIDVVQGMLYLHSQEIPIVHRDLKSVNVFCSVTYGCKVGDFGLSRRYYKDLDALKTIVGTPFWLAPEIIRNGPYGPPADVYSFGIVLTELETRRMPYHDQKDTSIKMLMRIAQDKLRPTLPESCLLKRRQLIMDCLNDDPALRPTFADVLKRLQGPVQQEVEGNAWRSTKERRERIRKQALPSQRHEL